ncbi:MAG: hypothetical protein ACYTBJ_15350 [Planctomycetota bacterium]|jgi:hypothetical protein
MTRRKFIQRLLGACSAVVVGPGWLAKKILPRRFVRALRLKKYPGRIVPLTDISQQAKWRG